MAGERVNRKLAAILAADVVGYSRLMAADGAGTLAALKRHREGVFDPAVAAHNGRVVKLIDDGTIVEFASVVDAVNCALSVQRSGAPAPRAAEPAIVLRIAINLGDVIMEGEDIYGDGVNIAARLEPLADPGGICISSNGSPQALPPIPGRPMQRVRPRGWQPHPSLFCRSPTCRETPNRSISPMGSAKTSLPICRRSPA
jgi:class 3 adenylate cyclase